MTVRPRDPYRDSATTTHSEVFSAPYLNAFGSAEDPFSGDLQNSTSSKSPVQDQTSPASLQSALAAFQSAGSRRRQTVEEGESRYFQQERERELESERARQQRIRDKAPGLRSKGNKVGEIDGMPIV
jgi:exocyst complex component 4